LINLLYNMCRYEQIIRLNLLTIKQWQSEKQIDWQIEKEKQIDR
jgi:hypothetical protein